MLPMTVPQCVAVKQAQNFIITLNSAVQVDMIVLGLAKVSNSYAGGTGFYSKILLRAQHHRLGHCSQYKSCSICIDCI